MCCIVKIIPENFLVYNDIWQNVFHELFLKKSSIDRFRNTQKQPHRDVLRKKCSENMHLFSGTPLGGCFWNTPLWKLKSGFLIFQYVEDSERLFTHEITSLDETRPRMKLPLSLGKCFLVFTRFRQRCKHFIPEKKFTMSMFF